MLRHQANPPVHTLLPVQTPAAPLATAAASTSTQQGSLTDRLLSAFFGCAALGALYGVAVAGLLMFSHYLPPTSVWDTKEAVKLTLLLGTGGLTMGIWGFYAGGRRSVAGWVVASLMGVASVYLLTALWLHYTMITYRGGAEIFPYNGYLPNRIVWDFTHPSFRAGNSLFWKFCVLFPQIGWLTGRALHHSHGGKPFFALRPLARALDAVAPWYEMPIWLRGAWAVVLTVGINFVAFLVLAGMRHLP